MAITLLTRVIAKGANTTTSVAIDTSGASLLVIALSGIGSPVISDSKGNAWIALTPQVRNGFSQLFYVLSPIVGPGHTFTFAGASVYGCMSITAWSGVSTYGSQNGANSGAIAFQTGPVTPVVGGLVVTGIRDEASAQSLTIDSGFTILDQSPISPGVSYGGGIAYQIAVSTATLNPTWTGSVAGDQFAATIATFLPIAGATFQPAWARGCNQIIGGGYA